jgi:hypothetical protein
MQGFQGQAESGRRRCRSMLFRQNSCGSGCDDGEPVIDIIAALSMAPG